MVTSPTSWKFNLSPLSTPIIATFDSSPQTIGTTTTSTTLLESGDTTRRVVTWQNWLDKGKQFENAQTKAIRSNSAQNGSEHPKPSVQYTQSRSPTTQAQRGPRTREQDRLGDVYRYLTSVPADIDQLQYPFARLHALRELQSQDGWPFPQPHPQPDPNPHPRSFRAPPISTNPQTPRPPPLVQLKALLFHLLLLFVQALYSTLPWIHLVSRAMYRSIRLIGTIINLLDEVKALGVGCLEWMIVWSFGGGL